MLEQRPQCWYGYNEIARFYLDQGRDEEAARALQAIVRLAPTHAAALHNLAFVYIKIGRNDDAIERAADSVRFGIGPLGYSTLGRAYQAKGCSSDALVNLRRAAEEADRAEERTGEAYPTSYLVWKNLADVLAESGREREAREAYEETVLRSRQYLADRPSHRVGLAYLALSLARLGETTAALKEAEKAVLVAPDNEEILLHAATVYEIAGDRDRALDLLASAFQNGLYVREAQHAVAMAHLRADPRYPAMLLRFGLDAGQDPGSTTLPEAAGCPDSNEAGRGLRERGQNS